MSTYQEMQAREQEAWDAADVAFNALMTARDHEEKCFRTYLENCSDMGAIRDAWVEAAEAAERADAEFHRLNVESGRITRLTIAYENGRTE